MRLEYFQMVDRIVSLSVAEQTIIAEAVVPDESTIFEGHFPGYPLMPGVLLIESMAQTSGWLVVALTQFERMPFLAQVKEAKLRNFVRPGARLTVRASLVHQGSGFAITRADISHEGKPMCSSELRFGVVPFPTEDLRGVMQSWAKRIEFPMDARVDA
jgi:3-hydroxyacyl-[acyl-carrier-protein] dehydratase